ncbi:hypothetical protein K461DRAFT_283157 [Myriangium duriaei CBS 260.36]|uniref:Uncharacterized protein n=1 Tax=Myriangium duriaei CBS 260.36 TaxID=1168546 RepID=A0A9P4MCD1_9PEZI|nr:hypothetical protein K461DRAFT_283157 [Myriangium duriaei CBS 260.36]
MLFPKALLLTVAVASVNVLAAKIQFAVHVNSAGADGEDKVSTYWSASQKIKEDKALKIAQNMRSWSGDKYKANYHNQKVVVENLNAEDDQEGVKDRVMGDMINIISRNTSRD